MKGNNWGKKQNLFKKKKKKEKKKKKKTEVSYLGVKPPIHQSELKTYMKVVPFQEKSSFHFGVLWKLLNGMD